MSNAKVWKHDELAFDLRNHLKGNRGARMVWCDMQLGPSGSPRPDVYVMSKSYSRFAPISYEIKVSRADYQSDINSAKWQKYFEFSSGVSFAVPDGLIKKTELPEGAGLIVRKDKVWRVAKAPKINHLKTLPHAVWMKLMIDGVDALKRSPQATNQYAMRDRVFRQQLGEEIADAIRDRESAVFRINAEKEKHQRELQRLIDGNQDAIERAKRNNETATRELDQLCDALGIRRNSHVFAIQTQVKRLRDELDRDTEISRLLKVTQTAENALKQIRENTASSTIINAVRLPPHQPKAIIPGEAR